MEPQVKNIQGDQFSSSLTFKQSGNWKSPQRQAVEVSCDGPLLQMTEKDLRLMQYPTVRRNAELLKRAIMTSSVGHRTGLTGSAGVNIMNTPEVGIPLKGRVVQESLGEEGALFSSPNMGFNVRGRREPAACMEES